MKGHFVYNNKNVRANGGNMTAPINTVNLRVRWNVCARICVFRTCAKQFLFVLFHNCYHWIATVSPFFPKWTHNKRWTVNQIAFLTELIFNAALFSRVARNICKLATKFGSNFTLVIM